MNYDNGDDAASIAGLLVLAFIVSFFLSSIRTCIHQSRMEKYQEKQIELIHERNKENQHGKTISR